MIRPFRNRIFVLVLVLSGLAVLGAERLEAQDYEGFREVSTEHFTFVYEDRDAEAVARLVAMADQVYRDVTALLEFEPEHSRVLVVGRTDFANGYYSPLPPRHMALFVSAPETDSLGSRHEDWLRLVFVHEFTHYVHLNYDAGILHGLSRVFGAPLMAGNVFFMPYWNVEGITTNSETLLTTGGRGRSAFFEMSYRALVIENELFTLKQAGYDSHLHPPGRYYVGGYLLVDHILRNYGIETYLDIHRDFLRFPFFGIYGAVRRNTGASVRDLYRDLRRELDERYRHLFDQPRGRRITPDQDGDYHLPKRGGQELFLYRRSPARRGALVAFDPRTGEERILAELPLSDAGAFSPAPDGGRIIFSALESRGGHPAASQLVAAESTSHLFHLDTESGRSSRIPGTEHLLQPALSPDERSIVAVERRGSDSRLVRLSFDPAAPAEAAEREPLFEAPGAFVGYPVYSPDGSQLAFTLRRDGEQEIVLLETVTETQRVIPGFEESAEHFPRFTGEGAVLFSSDRTGSLALYGYDPGRGESRLILRDPVGAYGGLIHGDELIYGSSSSRGRTLLATDRGELNMEPVPAQATMPGGPKPQPTPSRAPSAPEASTAGAANAADFVAGNSRPYRDWPAPALWFPYAPVTSGAEGGLGVGGGASVQGTSLLGRWNWAVSAAFLPGFLQPREATGTLEFDRAPQLLGSLSLGYRFGGWQLGYAAANSYLGGDGAATQAVQQSLTLGRTLISRTSLGVGHALTAGAGLSHRLRLIGSGNFGFFAAPGGSVRVNELAQNASLSYRRSVSRAPEEFFGARGEVDAAFGASAMLPVLDGEFTGLVLQGLFGANAPGFGPADATRIELRGFYNTGAAAATRPLIVQPRDVRVGIIRAGALPRVDPARQGNLLLHLGYRRALGRVDWPILPAVGILGFSSNLYGEGTIAFGRSNPAGVTDFGVTVEPVISLGAELVSLIAVKSVNLPVGIGANLRLDPRDPLGDPTQLRPYLFLDFTLPTGIGDGGDHGRLPGHSRVKGRFASKVPPQPW